MNNSSPEPSYRGRPLPVDKSRVPPPIRTAVRLLLVLFVLLLVAAACWSVYVMSTW